MVHLQVDLHLWLVLSRLLMGPRRLTAPSTLVTLQRFVFRPSALPALLLTHLAQPHAEINNYVLGPILSIPLVVMAAFDFPRRHKWVWQTWVVCCTWMSAAANVIDMRLCEYYLPTRHCANRDFLGTLY